MNLCDVNVLVYAHRPDATVDHRAYAAWLTAMAEGPAAYALSESVLSAFVRVVTNPRVFRDPTPTPMALDFCDRLLRRPNAQVLRPGPHNWEIFQDLCRKVSARGKLVADAWHAALAMGYGSTGIPPTGTSPGFPD